MYVCICDLLSAIIKSIATVHYTVRNLHKMRASALTFDRAPPSVSHRKPVRSPRRFGRNYAYRICAHANSSSTSAERRDGKEFGWPECAAVPFDAGQNRYLMTPAHAHTRTHIIISNLALVTRQQLPSNSASREIITNAFFAYRIRLPYGFRYRDSIFVWARANAWTRER